MRSSFRTRLVLIFGGLFAAAMVGTFLRVTQEQAKAASDSVARELAQDSVVFDDSVRVRSEMLLEVARGGTNDFGFKKAYVDGDPATFKSAMDNLRGRLGGADLMLLLSLDGEILDSTETVEEEPEGENPWLEMIYDAEEDEFLQSSAIIPFGGRVLQATVFPFLLPDLEAWVGVGFRIDQGFVEEFERLTLAQITVVRRSVDGWVKEASTLSDETYSALVEALPNHETQLEQGATLRLHGVDFVARSRQMAGEPELVLAILQRSLQEELAPYQRVRRTLVKTFALGLLLAVAGAVLAAGNVTRPVLAIADAAARIEQGEFDLAIAEGRRDEIGQMAISFNRMARGLAEKERVRNLLGKVVSPAIAEELLNQNFDLGGEEREVTILFSDVRAFTSLCEGRSPGEILDFLNLYLTEVSKVISDRHGVVDKYIGDAVMALFGAPVAHDDDPANAVLAAREMLEAVDRLNPLVREKGWPLLEIGIGINTDEVVAGNMGSVERMNYTVIGDGVNLAARLEGLTKNYGLPILVSESTAMLAPKLPFREIDRVRVKGKQQPVRLYEALDPSTKTDPEDDLFARGLRLYRQRTWEPAAACFSGFAQESPTHAKLVGMFLARIENLRKNPPSDDWDTTHTFTEK